MAAAAEVIDIGKGAGEVVPQKLAKALAEFNLPNETSQLIGWTQDRLEEGARVFFLAGLGLIKLHMTTMGAYSALIEQNFPGLNERTAWNYMAYARALINHPAFQAFQKERGGYSKALTVLGVCSEAEIDAADDSGELLGYSMEQLAKMSVRTMQKTLLRAREHEKQAVKKATGKLSEENAELRDQVKDLAAQVAAGETAADAALKLIKSANDKILEGFRLLAKVDKEVIIASEIVRDAMFGVVGLVFRVMSNVETETSRAIAAAAREGEGS